MARAVLLCFLGDSTRQDYLCDESGEEDVMSSLRSILEGKHPTTYAVGPAATVLDAIGMMCRSHVGALLVNEHDMPIGILSDGDIMRRVLLERRDPSTTRVSDIMTREVVLVEPQVDPEEAMALMTERRVSQLPVVESRTVIGIISVGDLLQWQTRNQEHEIRTLKEYVSGAYPG
jgi:CBS domain-containing protein